MQVRVIAIAAEQETIEQAGRVLRVWAATPPAKHPEGLTVKEEIKRITDALVHNDREVLDEYGGFNEALQRGVYLEKLPEGG